MAEVPEWAVDRAKAKMRMTKTTKPLAFCHGYHGRVEDQIWREVTTREIWGHHRSQHVHERRRDRERCRVQVQG